MAELARHFVLADPASAQAWEYSAAAAGEPTARLAYEEAVRHWEHAVAAADARPGGRVEVLLELAEARRRAGQGQAAGRAYLRAAVLARGDDPPRPPREVMARTPQDLAGPARAALRLPPLGPPPRWPPDPVGGPPSAARGPPGSGPRRQPLRPPALGSPRPG